MDAYVREREILMHRAMPHTHVRNLIWQNEMCGTCLCFHLKKNIFVTTAKKQGVICKEAKGETVKEPEDDHFTAVDRYFSLSVVSSVTKTQRQMAVWSER